MEVQVRKLHQAHKRQEVCAMEVEQLTTVKTELAQFKVMGLFVQMVNTVLHHKILV